MHRESDTGLLAIMNLLPDHRVVLKVSMKGLVLTQDEGAPLLCFGNVGVGAPLPCLKPYQFHAYFENDSMVFE